MFVALDKLANQKLKQAIIVVPEKAIGASFHNVCTVGFGIEGSFRLASRAEGVFSGSPPRDR
jgi:hypothetical protein